MHIQNTIKSRKTVAILLATYNGARFLPELLDSLLGQTCTDLCVFVHDDGSTDGTTDVLNDYRQRHSEQVILLDYPPQGGACNNFFSLIEHVEAPYYMFCDQDDIWHKDKVEKSLRAIQQEEKNDPALPYFSYCNLRIVDAAGRVLHDDFWNTCQLYPEMYRTLRHRVSFTIPGCTIMINNRAKQVRGDYSEAFMHDGWFMVRTLAEGGKVIPVNEALMDYRQHDTNTVGVECCRKNRTLLYKLRHLRFLYQQHVKTYRMLHAAGYGSVLTYIIYKVRENIVRARIRKQRNRT